MKIPYNSQYEENNSSVIHIAPTPFFANRGCHIRILNEIEGLKQNGINVILCTYGLGENIGNVDIRRIPSIPGYTKTDAGFSPYKFIADILLFFLVLRTTFKENISILHGHLHEGGLIGWAVKIILFWRKIVVVMDTQGSLSGELQTYGTFNSFPFLLKVFYFFERIISQLPHLVICSSPSTERFIINSCGVNPTRVNLLGDVVPDDFFINRDMNFFKERVDIPFNKEVVIYSGSLLPGKGVDLLLEAMKVCLIDNDDTLFIILGYPKQWVVDYVRQHKISDKVMVIGEVPYQELASWLSTADLAIDPKPTGSGEASGKILHYMASALPIVCFKTKNNTFFLGDNCFYASAETAEDLSEAIRKALGEKDQRARYGYLGKTKAKADYSLFAAGKRLKAIYSSLLP